MKKLPEYPALRKDIQILAAPTPGHPDRYFIKDPLTGETFQFSEKEHYLCLHLDGATSLSEIQSLFRKEYSVDLNRKELESFLRQVSDYGLLTSSDPAQRAAGMVWDRMKPLPFYFDRLFQRLAIIFSGLFSRWFLIIFLLLMILSAGIVFENRDLLVLQIETFIQGELLQTTFISPFFGLSTFLLLVAIPFFREVSKAIACRHYRGRIARIRYIWYVRLVPRFCSDITSIYGMNKNQQLLTVAAGPALELFIMTLSIIFWQTSPTNDLSKTIWMEMASMGLISFIFNVNPLAKGDGSLLLSLLFNENNLRQRAVASARSYLLRKPAPEPLKKKKRGAFIRYGIMADIYYIIFTGFFLGIAGYLLTQWLQLTGLIIFLALLTLRFEEEIRRFFMSIPFWKKFVVWVNFGKSPKIRHWLVTLGILLILIGLYFIPYYHETGGWFRIQPTLSQEIRAKVNGQIEKVLVDEGTWVEKNQPIIYLSIRDIKKDLDLAEASLSKEEAQLALIKSGRKPEEIAQAEQEVKSRETILTYSTSQAQRVGELHEKKHVSDQDYENTLKQRDADKEALELARKNLEVVRSKARPEEIAIHEAEIQRLKTLVTHLRESLALTEILSPISGRITTPYLKQKIDQLVNVGDLLAMVEDNREILVEITVPEEYGGELKVGAPVRIKPWAYSHKIFTGKVTSIAPVVVEKQENILQQSQAEEKTGGEVRSLDAPEENVVRVFARTLNSEGLLKSEMTGYAKIKAQYQPLGSILLSPVIRFFRVQVWHWLP